MLPNYDAKAVAEVMGLAFVRESKEGKAEKGRPKSVSSKFGHDFVIRVDDATIRIVDIKAKNPLALGKRLSQLKSDLVSSPSPVFIEKAVESGLPRSALRHLAESIAGDDRAKVSRPWNGAWSRRLLLNAARPSYPLRRANERSASHASLCTRGVPSVRKLRRASS